MNKFESVTKPLMWFMALLLAALVAGCGGGSQDPILGGGGGGGAITAPTVTITSPVNNTAVLTTTSTIVATFSEAMDPATLTPASFTLTCLPAYAGGFGAIVMSAGNTVATLPLLGALPVTACTATVTTAAKSLATGLALVAGAVPNPWTFTTNAPPPVIATVIPGTGTCAAANADLTIPRVISSNPTHNNQNATIETAGAGGNKLITATFSLAMDAATIDDVGPTSAASTFSLKNNTTPGNVAGAVLYDAPSKVATLTVPTLLDDTSYTATITVAATTPGGAGKPLACVYEWTFKTAPAVIPPAPAGQAPVNLGTASTYGIFVVNNASLTLTGPSTLINGDVGFMSNGAGSCITNPGPANIFCNNQIPAITGVVHNGDAAAAAAQVDFNAAYVDAAGRATGVCSISLPADISAVQAACAGYAAPPGSIGPTGFSTYLPGLYSAGFLNLPVGATIVLDAQNDPNAVFIFQATGSTLDTGSGSTIILTNQAKASNVYWTVASAATLGVSSTFRGTVITGGPGAAALTVNGGTALLPTLVEGSMFSGAAATVGTFATINVPVP